ncbi:uncharacterized protein LOC135155244 [Lytechinus pictus]|uniref:uncharacterized protein LOC135155244 n=1 Tax=Lytechinus pictus TaxID=7653 RepID=UPI0030B9E72E
MAWSKHLPTIRNVIVLLLTTRTLIASTMVTPVSQETTESSLSSTGLDMNSQAIDCGEQSHQVPQNLSEGPLNVTIGNLTIPICPDRHSCPEKSCMVNEDGNRGCSCDEFCQFFGDCCPKAASKDHPRESSNNSTLYGYDRSYFSCERIEKTPSSSYYYLISKCSDASVSDQMREKCESPSAHLGSLNYEYIPLSLDDILSYRNVYCAICNGVELLKLTPWKVLLHCPDDVVEDLKNHSRTVDEIVRDMLCLFSVVPSSEETAARICIGDSVNYVEKCPPLSDMALQLACASFSAHIILENRYGDCVSYKNPVCYACNVGQFPPGRRMCPPECSGGPGFGTVSFISPLSILFDFSSESGIKVVQENTVISETTVACQSGEVFDPYIGSCLRLSCSDGYEMIGDECAKDVSADDSK